VREESKPSTLVIQRIYVPDADLCVAALLAVLAWKPKEKSMTDTKEERT
jgi:hypothetical protein